MSLHRRSIGGIAALVCVFFHYATASAQDLTNFTVEGTLTVGADVTPVLLPDGRMRLYGSVSPTNSPCPGGGIVSAVTSDGRNFTNDPGCRLPYSAGLGGVSLTRVVPLSNGQYRMFFSSGLTEGGTTGGIGSAISSDGLNFTVEPGLRVPASALPSIPSDALMRGIGVVTMPDGTYRMYFGIESQSKPPNPAYILSATSTDMLNWTIEPDVRLGPGSAVNVAAAHPFAMRNGDGSITVFFYSVLQPNDGVQFATSSDGLSFTTETITSLYGPAANCAPCGDPAVYPLPDGRLRMYFDNFNPANQATTVSSATSNEPAPGTTELVAAVLPSSRSVQVGNTATAFATVINAGLGQGLSCQIAPVSSVPVTFSYQTTDSATNALSGSANTPVQIAANAAQSFVIALTSTAAFAPTDVQLSLVCDNGAPAPIVSGLDTLLLSGSTTPVPDIVALAASGDPGIVDIPGNTGSGAFAVATVNVGASGSITATADTGSAMLPVSISLCQTNPATSVCINPASPGSSATVTINAGDTPTFAIFVTGTGAVSFAPGTNRVFVRFKDSGGATRGSTSVAVRTQ